MHKHTPHEIADATREAVALHDRVLAALATTYVLDVIRPEEHLSREELDRLFIADDDALDTLVGRYRRHREHRRSTAAEDVIAGHLDRDRDPGTDTAPEKELLVHNDLLHCLIEEVLERDQGDIVGALMARSGRYMFSYDLGVDLPSRSALTDLGTWVGTVRAIREAVGLDLADHTMRTAVRSLLHDAPHGGRLFVAWIDDPANAWRLVRPPRVATAIRAADPTGIVFTDALLCVIDEPRISGFAVRIHRITTRWAARLVAVDSGPYSESEMPVDGEFTTIAPTISTAEFSDWPVCHCGNDPYGSGFWPIDSTGTQVEPEPRVWGNLMLCPDCGIVHDTGTYDETTRTFTVVGHLDLPAVSETSTKA